jgi:hypothetical protein
MSREKEIIMNKKDKKQILLLKGLVVIAFFLVIIPLRTAAAADLYYNTAPRFTKVSSYTSGPVTGSEPGNIFWKDKSPSSVESFYKNNGWKVVSQNLNTWAHQVTDFDPILHIIPIKIHIRVDMATWDIKSYVGGSLKTQWEGKTFIANTEYVTLIDYGPWALDFPMKRDHFRIWDVGSDVMGVATYDNGLGGEFITAVVNFLNNPVLRAAIVAVSILFPTEAFVIVLGILVAFGFFDLLNGYVNLGHLICSNNPWKTQYTARQTWDLYSSNYKYTGFDRCGTYTWSLTGHSVSWDGYSYQCYYQSGGGGSPGGCVAKGTEILLDDGVHTKKVQELEIGDWVLGYNISSGETVPIRVTNVTKTIVPSLLNINEGLLKTTLLNQPIYMRNDTYTGWITDPIDLKVGEEIFNVPNQKWIKIYRLETSVGQKFKVYDVETDTLNVFVGNGILLDIKPK